MYQIEVTKEFIKDIKALVKDTKSSVKDTKPVVYHDKTLSLSYRINLVFNHELILK